MSLRHLPSLSRPFLRKMSTSPQHQTFTLPDGRLLGFAEYGSLSDHPLLYFHGYPCCRLEGGPAAALASRHGFRLIALDRPGFGLSSPLPDRRFSDWPEDVRAFAEGMQIPRFAVLGLSGGGPYALACARFLPREMLSAVGLFATGPHWAAGRHHMSWFRRFLSVWSTRAPGSLTLVLNALTRAWQWIVSTNFITTRLDKWLDAAKEKKSGSSGTIEDETVAEWMSDRPTAEKREALIDLMVREPYRQGAAATTHEAMLLSADDWGFRLEDVDYDEVKVWHGVEDGNAPIQMVRWMAERLPRCRLREFEGETHYTMWKHLDGAFADMVEGGG